MMRSPVSLSQLPFPGLDSGGREASATSWVRYGPLRRGIEAGIFGEDERVQLIPENWIVNLGEATVEVHREPDAEAGAYQMKTVMPSGETLTVDSVPGITVDVATLFR